ncbi:MAG TPA: MYXO-CTERM sorting domain-containing protein, partial [Nannocystis sp.]
GTGLPAHGDYSYGAYQSNWALWPVGELLRLDGSGERCVVLGATSLIDGSTAMSEPRCAEIAAPREATLMPEFLPADLEGSGMGECLSPPVYEHSGEPYLPYDGGETTVEQGGCRVAGQGPWGLLVLGLVWRRRARRG